MMVFVEERLCVNVSNTMCLDMLAFSCNQVIYSKTAKKKNGTKGAFWICIELPLLCTLTKDNIGGILSSPLITWSISLRLEGMEHSTLSRNAPGLMLFCEICHSNYVFIWQKNLHESLRVLCQKDNKFWKYRNL